MNNGLEALQVFGMALPLIIYILVERAGNVQLLRTPAARFLAPGAVSLLVVVLWYLAQQPKPPVYLAVVVFMALWVASMMVKSTVKDKAQQPPDKPAT